MTIKIIPDGGEITLTESEYARLQQEYNQAFMFFAGTVPTFEEWVRQKRASVAENVLIQG